MTKIEFKVAVEQVFSDLAQYGFRLLATSFNPMTYSLTFRKNDLDIIISLDVRDEVIEVLIGKDPIHENAFALLSKIAPGLVGNYPKNGKVIDGLVWWHDVLLPQLDKLMVNVSK